MSNDMERIERMANIANAAIESSQDKANAFLQGCKKSLQPLCYEFVVDGYQRGWMDGYQAHAKHAEQGGWCFDMEKALRDRPILVATKEKQIFVVKWSSCDKGYWWLCGTNSLGVESVVAWCHLPHTEQPPKD